MTFATGHEELKAIGSSAAGHIWVVPIIICAVFIALATSTVVLRLAARRMKRAPLKWDDYWIIIGLVLTYGLAAATVVGVVAGGAGIHITELSNGQIIIAIKALIAAELLWVYCLTAIKISLVLLYMHIFAVKRFCLLGWITIGAVLCYSLGGTLFLVLQCRFLSDLWDPTVKAVCTNLDVGGLSIGTAALILDVIILSLPIPMVWRLQLPKANKIALSGIFCIGFLVCVISSLRLRAVHKASYVDIPYTEVGPQYWSIIEPSLGIVSACLLVMRPIFDKILPKNIFHRTVKRPIITSPPTAHAKPWGGRSSNERSVSLGGEPYGLDSVRGKVPRAYERLSFDKMAYPLEPMKRTTIDESAGTGCTNSKVETPTANNEKE